MTIAVLGIFAIDLNEGLSHAQGAAFTAIVMFELIMLYIIRSNFKTSFFSNPWLLYAVFATVAIQILIVFIPFISVLFEIENINLFDWTYIIFASCVLWTVLKLTKSLPKT